MAEETQGLIQDGWFHERNKQWPGKALSIQMKEGTVHIEQSQFQQVICFESTHHGNVLVLDGAIQCCSSDEFS
ncbi:MAG: saccharopine dehydrogenase (NADP+, L-glutamate-forming) [Ramalina farinacea]|uniref:Saccharopine dehydrogenase (NADP+, L-glutamate-forming) n=1 Tax=Ramalina farinacea TaxID=258253 RepID=A0AA43TUF4_9LECA|nr:saccharopine dehydrogenase (NADP+, L-glutamate-forming) [Ramalina farinacea]